MIYIYSIASLSLLLFFVVINFWINTYLCGEAYTNIFFFEFLETCKVSLFDCLIDIDKDTENIFTTYFIDTAVIFENRTYGTENFIEYVYKNRTFSSVDQFTSQNILCAYFESKCFDKQISFISLHDHIYFPAGEVVLVFYRITNPTEVFKELYAFYILHPTSAMPFFEKIQCFCFEFLMVSSKTTIDLPILFNVNLEFSSYLVDKIILEYILLKF